MTERVKVAFLRRGLLKKETTIEQAVQAVERKRILFIIRTYVPDQAGGAAKSVQTLAEGLVERGHDVHVLRLAPKGEEQRYFQRATEAHVAGPGKPELHILPIRNIYWPSEKEDHSRLAKLVWHALDLYNPWAARDLQKFLAELQPDVVNTSIIDGFSPAILRAIRQSGVALIHTMRDYNLICSRSAMFRNGHSCESLCGTCQIVRTFNFRRARHVDLFLSNSVFVAETHRRFGGFPPEAPCAVQWNINNMPLTDSPRDLKESAIVFGYIGRLSPSKGVEQLIRAAAQLPVNGRPWSLVIAGDGGPEYVESLKDASRELSNVEYLGWVGAEQFYKQVDVVICPSTYHDPLPRVIYEAYGFGLPVIASRVGGNPEIVTEGESGELFAAEDSAGLTQHMQMFRELPNARYRDYSGHAIQIAAEFAPGAVLDSYEKHLYEVCGKAMH